MIRSFKHKGLESFFNTGAKAGINPPHSQRLIDMLALLNAAKELMDMDAPGLGLHPLKGNLKGHWSVEVNGPWRVTFRFDKGDVHDTDYRQYH